MAGIRGPGRVGQHFLYSLRFSLFEDERQQKVKKETFFCRTRKQEANPLLMFIRHRCLEMMAVLIYNS